MKTESDWLLAFTGDEILRLELPPGGGAGPARVFLKRGGTAGAAAGPVLETLPRRAGVWVWLADGWCQTLSLNADLLDGADGAARTARLAYEAEPFSGLRPDDALTAAETARGAGTAALCRIFQASRRDVESLATAAEGVGCRLLGVGHPGQLSPPAGPDGLAAPEPPPFAPGDAERLAAEWSARARAGTLPPTLRPAGAQAGGGAGRIRRGLAGAGAALLLLVACAGWWAGRDAAAVRAENDVLLALDAEAKRAEAGVSRLLGMRDDIRRKHLEGLAPRRRLQELRGRTAALCEALCAWPEEGGGEWMLRGVKSPDPFVHEIEAWAGTPDAADALLERLAERLTGAGLAVVPRGTEALRMLDNGGPWKVVFLVKAADGGEEAR